MFQVLVVEDDQELNRTVCAYLNQNGYQALGCLNANEAYDAMYGGTLFDLIISDIMMPGVDGFAFAKTVRELNQEIPILFMTARDDFASKQRGFQAGIDDYMVKPIDLDELLLRMEALLRRARIASSKKLTVGGLTLDAEEHTAYLNGEEIPLTVREFNLIYKLLSYPKKTFTRSQRSCRSRRTCRRRSWWTPTRSCSRWFGTTCSPTRSNSPSRTAKSPSRCGRRGNLPSSRCRIPDAASRRRWENTSLKSFTRGTPPTPPRATAWGLRWLSG